MLIGCPFKVLKAIVFWTSILNILDLAIASYSSISILWLYYFLIALQFCCFAGNIDILFIVFIDWFVTKRKNQRINLFFILGVSVFKRLLSCWQIFYIMRPSLLAYISVPCISCNCHSGLLCFPHDIFWKMFYLLG